MGRAPRSKAVTLACMCGVAVLVVHPRTAVAQGVSRGRAPEAQTDVGPVPDASPEEERGKPRLPYDRNKPVPPGFKRTSTYDLTFIAAGSAVFGFSYVASMIIGALSAPITEPGREGDERNNDALFVPLIGPFIAIGTDDRNAADIALLVSGGVLQAAGFSLLMVGLAKKRYYIELDRDDARLYIAPTGLGFEGRF